MLSVRRVHGRRALQRRIAGQAHRGAGRNHDRASELAITHLLGLGHREIAFIKGQSFSSDTDVRWDSIVRVAKRLGVTVKPDLVTQLQGESPSPEVGYAAMAQLLERGVHFTALFSFNDVSAIGAINRQGRMAYSTASELRLFASSLAQIPAE